MATTGSWHSLCTACIRKTLSLYTPRKATRTFSVEFNQRPVLFQYQEGTNTFPGTKKGRGFFYPFRLRDGPKRADDDAGDDVERDEAAKDYGSTGTEGAQRLRNHGLRGRTFFSGAFRRTARVQ